MLVPVIMLGVLLLIVILGFLAAKITDYCYKRRYANLRKKHPRLYELAAERDEASRQRHLFWEENYYIPKTEIDNILENARYCTAAQKEKDEMRLEELREKIAYYHAHCDEYNDPISRLQAQMDEYAEKNNLKNY